MINHYIVMFIIMFIAGMLSTMNMWVNDFNDIRISLNDFYMVFLMCGWMIVFMAIYYGHKIPLIIGLLLVVFMIICIRKQLFIDQRQYLLGMIPHHSMAILMSKKLSEKNNDINELLENIIKTQYNEINYMKQKLI